MSISSIGGVSPVSPYASGSGAASSGASDGKLQDAINLLIQFLQELLSSQQGQDPGAATGAGGGAGRGSGGGNASGGGSGGSGSGGSGGGKAHRHHHHHHHHAGGHHGGGNQVATSGGDGGSGGGTASRPEMSMRSLGAEPASTGAQGGRSVPVNGLNTDPGDPSHKLSANVPKDMEQYRGAIEAASVRTGVPANRIAGVIWAESRSNLNHPESSRNADGTTDYGLMQIGQKRYDQDIRGVTGGPALNVQNSADNIMAGAFELKKDFMDKGSWTKVHEAYVGHGNSDDAKYAAAVNGYTSSLDAGNGLQDSSGF